MKRYLFILILGILLGLFLRDLLGDTPTSAKVVTVRSRNLTFQMETRDPELTHGQIIKIPAPVQVEINDSDSTSSITTTVETVGDLLYEQDIILAETDRLTPAVNSFLTDGTRIKIDRIVDLEVEERNKISFEIVRENDNTLYYGQEAVVQEGKEGQKQETFLITYKNGVETARKLLSSQVLQDPVARIVRFGTKIEIQEYGRGRASWYSYRDCNCAAHPHYEFGRFAKVTNEQTGKSVIVRINDRGPNLEVHPDRIIDLDVRAYEQLAPLSSGVIPVRVELLKQ